mgnify:CR=1 FL=1
MKIIFIGDIVGKNAREAVIKMFNGGRGINSNPYRFWVLLILALWFDQNK